MSNVAGAAPGRRVPHGDLVAKLTAASEWLLAAAVILGVLSAGWQAFYKITAPYQLDYGEGVVLAGALRVAQGQSLYPPVKGVPYVIDPWGPVLYLLLAAPARIFGASFVAPRLLSAAATLASTLFLFLLLRLWTRSRKVALIFSLLYLSLPVIRVWSWLLRPDHFGIAFSLAGIYLFAARPRRWLVAACLFVAAAFIKPTFIAAPLAVFLYLLAQKQRSRALGFAICTAGMGLAAFAIMQGLTGGAFAFHFLRTHPGYALAHFVGMTALVVWGFPALDLLGWIFVAQSLWRSRYLLPVLYFCTSKLVTLSSGNEGASGNHFLEWAATLCLVAGVAYDCLSRQQPRRVYNQLACNLAVVGVVASLMVFFPLVFMPWQRLDQKIDLALLEYSPIRGQFAGLLRTADPRDSMCPELQAFLRRQVGSRALSENVGTALLSGKRLLVSEPFIYRQLVSRSELSAEPLAAMIRSRQVDFIILNQETPQLRLPRKGTGRSWWWEREGPWPSSILDGIEENYAVSGHFQCPNAAVVYLPRP